MAGLVGSLVALMFLLSKLLPLLQLPLGIALLLVIWGAARGNCWPGIQRPHNSVLLIFARRPAAVVGGRAPPGARASEWIDTHRFFAGLASYVHLNRQAETAQLIFTGGWWPTQPALPPDGDVLRGLAIALGLPPEAVAITS